MRRVLLVVAVVLGVAVLFGGAVSLFATPTTDAVAPETAEDPDVYTLADHESGVWPFLSPAPEPVERSPINVIVRGETDRVVAVLQERGDHDWESTDPDEGHADFGTFVPEEVDLEATEIEWAETTGTSRYAYVHDGEEGQWIRETGQLHDGTYYGERTHIRLYESPHPDEHWVAMQVHTEHFDWFTLRHAVDGVEQGQRQVEADLMDQPFVDQVSREYLGNDGPSDADGWASIVELAMAALLVGTLSVARLTRSHLAPVDRRRLRMARDRIGLQHVLLATAIGAILLGIRAAGILLELYVPMLSMHAIGALLYPAIAIGIPLVTYLLARGFERRIDAGASASLGLGAAILVDYAVVSVSVLPIEVVLHRIGIVLSIGLLAAGAARRSSRETRLDGLAVWGILLWVLLLAVMLFQLV